MSITLDVGEIGRELSALTAHPHLRKLVVVLPLAPGMREVARDVVAEGPPFDPAGLGITEHEVFLSDAEAVFTFALAEGPETLERLLAQEDFWSVVSTWERIASGRPRIAEVAYDSGAELTARGGA